MKISVFRERVQNLELQNVDLIFGFATYEANDLERGKEECCGLNYIPPLSNLYVEALITIMMVFGDGGLGDNWVMKVGSP